jgi:hypothetical protein
MRVAVRRMEYSSARGYVRLEAVMVDGSELHVFEYVDSALRRISYAYHFQDKDGELVFRYDNEPHFPRLSSFPHHKHVGDASPPVASASVKLEDALLESAKFIAGA